MLKLLSSKIFFWVIVIISISIWALSAYFFWKPKQENRFEEIIKWQKKIHIIENKNKMKANIPTRLDF